MPGTYAAEVSLADDAARLAAAASTSPEERSPTLAARLFGVHTARVLPPGADPAHIAARDGYRFYAATPVTTSDGRDLGTLCVLGEEPRAVSREGTELRADLAARL